MDTNEEELFSKMRVHRCRRGHHHFHLVAGLEMHHVSMPFTTFDHGVRAFSRLLYQMWYREEAQRCSLRAFLAKEDEPFTARYQLLHKEEARVVAELERLSRTPRRERGRFAAGVLLEPTGTRIHWEREMNQARLWPRFVSHSQMKVETYELYEAVERVNGIFRHTGRYRWFSSSLRCDFVEYAAYSPYGYCRSPRELGLKP